MKNEEEDKKKFNEVLKEMTNFQLIALFAGIILIIYATAPFPH